MDKEIKTVSELRRIMDKIRPGSFVKFMNSFYKRRDPWESGLVDRDSLQSLIDRNKSVGLIMSSGFAWGMSSEGFGYWEELHAEVVNELS